MADVRSSAQDDGLEIRQRTRGHICCKEGMNMRRCVVVRQAYELHNPGALPRLGNKGGVGRR
jgi:hypothetical protein